MQDRGERITPTVEEQLCFEIKTILLAGHETSAAMLTWSLLELTRHPDCLQKVSYTCMLGCNMLTWDTMLLCCMLCASPASEYPQSVAAYLACWTLS